MEGTCDIHGGVFHLPLGRVWGRVDDAGANGAEGVVLALFLLLGLF